MLLLKGDSTHAFSFSGSYFFVFVSKQFMKELNSCRRSGHPHIAVFDECADAFVRVRWNANHGSTVLQSQNPSEHIQERIESFLDSASSRDSEAVRVIKSNEQLLGEAKSRPVHALDYDNGLVKSLTFLTLSFFHVYRTATASFRRPRA